MEWVSCWWWGHVLFISPPLPVKGELGGLILGGLSAGFLTAQPGHPVPSLHLWNRLCPWWDAQVPLVGCPGALAPSLPSTTLSDPKKDSEGYGGE